MADQKDITLADVYHRIGTLEGKMDQALGLEDRVRSLEDTRSRVYGASALLSAAVAFVTTYFGK